MYGLGGLGQVEVEKRRNWAKWLEKEKEKEKKEKEKEKTRCRSVPDGSDNQKQETAKNYKMDSQIKNIAKGTTDPRVEFISQVLKYSKF